LSFGISLSQEVVLYCFHPLPALLLPLDFILASAAAFTDYRQTLPLLPYSLDCRD